MEACLCSSRMSEVTAGSPLPFPLAGGVQSPCQGHFLHPLCLVLPCVCSVSEQIAHLRDLLWKPQLCNRLQTQAWNVLFLFLF